ncbi:MAG TPA: hypothetical protein ENN03_11920 [bacterium]|nr:hypothetical protein [bacterium]
MRKYYKYGVGFIFALFMLIMILLGYREYRLRRLPLDDIQLPLFEHHEQVQIPPRPGIHGIVISGPVIEDLIFSIDYTKAGVRSLDWNRLIAMDPNADILIKGTIDDQGRLNFTRDDVRMEGHTEAGIMIQNVLRTWIYKPYKTGKIQFWFNLPSKGRKLIIDTSGLIQRSNIPAHIIVSNGRIYNIDGIHINDIQERGQF